MRKRKIFSLLLVEGETEEELFSEIGRIYLKSAPKKIKNLRGNFNINAKIMDAATQFAQEHPDQDFNLYVCVDQERVESPPFNHLLIDKHLQMIPTCKTLVPVIAVLMVESLFFIDIDGIYSHLRAPKAKRKPTKYREFRNLTHIDLSNLYKQFSKVYHKGRRCHGLIAALDLDKLIANAVELRNLVSTISEG